MIWKMECALLHNCRIWWHKTSSSLSSENIKKIVECYTEYYYNSIHAAYLVQFKTDLGISSIWGKVGLMRHNIWYYFASSHTRWSSVIQVRIPFEAAEMLRSFWINV